MLTASSDLFVERNADWIDNRIGQVVDELNRAAVVRKSVTVCVCALAISPIERINSELEMISDSNFQFLTKSDVVQMRVAAGRSRPGDCVFHFDAAGRRCRGFIQIGKVARATKSGQRW